MTGNRRKIDTTPTFDAFNIHLRQTAAFTERIVVNAGDRVWNGDARQAAAMTERTDANAGDRVWNGDARQTISPTERIEVNNLNSISLA